MTRTTCLFCRSQHLVEPENRESVRCMDCRVSWRAESCLVAVLEGLGYPDLGEMPRPDMSRAGLGISDDWRVARLLASTFAYANTFLHKYPTLDVRTPPTVLVESQEFVVCSDVLEHVHGSVVDAVNGLFSIIREGGFLVVSVPIAGSSHKELYPDAVELEVERDRVAWIDSRGLRHVNLSPTFHSGAGLTLVTRQFSYRSTQSLLRHCGFTEIKSSSRLARLADRSLEAEGVFIARKVQAKSG